MLQETNLEMALKKGVSWKAGAGFGLNCIDCGQPVAMKYNEKKKLYETIRG